MAAGSGDAGSGCTKGTTAAATSPVCTGSAGHAADAGQFCGGIYISCSYLIPSSGAEGCSTCRAGHAAGSIIGQSCGPSGPKSPSHPHLHHQDQRAAELAQQPADEVQHDQLSQEQAQDEDMNIHMSQQHQPHQPPDHDHPQPPPLPQPLLPPTPIGCQQYQDPVQSYSLGPMNVHCPHCHALHFLHERLTHSSNANPQFGLCCLQGQVQLPPHAQPPPTLSSLFTGSGQPQKQFRERIRQYNAAFAFTSIAAHINDSVLSGSGPYSFILHGSLHHKMGALLPPPGFQPSYAQLYVLDPDSATNARYTRNSNLLPSTMSVLHAMLLQHNPYVQMYKQAHQFLREKPEEEQHNVRLCITVDPNTDLRRYNAPTVNEIAAIIPGGGEEHVHLHRDIVLHLHGGGLTRISHLHHSYTPLHYVMLFPNG